MKLSLSSLCVSVTYLILISYTSQKAPAVVHVHVGAITAAPRSDPAIPRARRRGGIARDAAVHTPGDGSVRWECASLRLCSSQRVLEEVSKGALGCAPSRRLAWPRERAWASLPVGRRG